MKKPKKIAVIGGDERSAVCADMFAKNGVECAVFGMEKYVEPLFATRTLSCADAVNECDVLILPLPAMCDGVCITAPMAESKIPFYDIIENLPNDTLIYVGNPQKCFFAALQSCDRKNTVVNYSDFDEFAILGSVPTAQGAVIEAICATKKQLLGAKVLVTGFGRVGKTLSQTLKALGADVTVSARKPQDLAYIFSCGLKHIKTSDIKTAKFEFDIIFNTVPAPIFDKETLESLLGCPTIIELASKPYGEGFNTHCRKAYFITSTDS